MASHLAGLHWIAQMSFEPPLMLYAQQPVFSQNTCPISWVYCNLLIVVGTAGAESLLTKIIIFFLKGASLHFLEDLHVPDKWEDQYIICLYWAPAPHVKKGTFLTCIFLIKIETYKCLYQRYSIKIVFNSLPLCLSNRITAAYLFTMSVIFI